jgi:predicted DsbA family dithiol-disulfide isomerase
MAAERGLIMRVPPIQTRTRRAHETAAFARAHGKFDEVDRALFRAAFEHGLDINETDVLASIVEQAGVDANGLRLALDTHEFTPLLNADIALARRLGINSVPTMLAADESGRAEPVVGAVPYEMLEPAIQRAFERVRLSAPGSAR